MVLHPETSSDPPIGSDLESGRDRDSVLEISGLFTDSLGTNFWD